MPTKGKYQNRLIHEKSPYLLQHADNPVDWYPWGSEALARAKEEDKPILVSIGYSSCHWCHVMAHESFEDDSVAALMNSSFINIKIDREERPDIDQVYMDAVQAMGRNPDATGTIQTNMILGIAFAEAVAIYCLVVALLLLFVF